MYRVCLVNLPFAGIETPSLALTQLRSVLEAELDERVSVELHYWNLELARAMGRERYRLFASSTRGHNAGLGEWFFRRAAFPEAPDNETEYFERYFRGGAAGEEMRRLVLELRDEAEGLLDDLIARHRLDRAALVGMTTMFFQTTACLALARRLKQRNADLVTVLGGANCESPMGEELARHAAAVDFVFSGPSLIGFPKLVGRLIEGDLESCHSIPGVFTARNLAGGTPPEPLGEELPLDVPVQLDYDSFLVDLDRTFGESVVRPHLLFETSRGCWWGAKAHCTFCGLNGSTMALRAMSAERALEQFEELFRYAPRCDYFECVDNLMPHTYLRQVFPRLEPPPGATIFYEVKASLTGEQLEMLARAGVRRMQAGIESLATSTLQLMKKGTTSFQNIRFLMNSVGCEIDPVWNLLIGFPGEEEEAYRRSLGVLPLLAHLPPPTGAYPVRFDRFSPYHTQAERFGLELRPYDFYELTFPFPRPSLDNLAYYFMDHALEAPYQERLLRWVDALAGAVEEWRAAWSADRTESRPILRFDGAPESCLVLDTRGGTLRRHDVGGLGRRLLLELEAPARLSGLARRMPELGHGELEAGVRALVERGLVFEEEDRFLGLVLPPLEQGTGDPAAGPRRLDRSAFRISPGSPGSV